MSEITAQRASEVLIYATVPSPPNLDPKIEVECARALDWAREMAQKIASGEYAPVVHGHWIPVNQARDGHYRSVKCSCCGTLQEGYFINANYCPKCSAVMDGKDDTK